MSGDLAAKGVRCRSARVFGGVVVATSEAGNVYRARAGAPLELLRVFADAGLCAEDAWPLEGGEILVAVASRPPAPVEAAPAAAPPAAPPPGRRGRPAPAADRRAGRVARTRSGPLGTRNSSAEALPAGWHEAYVALRDARGRSVARGGWDVACTSTAQTEVIDRGDGVYVVRALAAPPEVALTVTVGGRPVGAARWRASVVADERPIKIYVKSDGRRMESHAQAYGVKRYGDTVRALKDQIAAKTGVAPARQRLWMGCLLLDDAATLAACGVRSRRCTSGSSRPHRRRRRRRRASSRPRPRCANARRAVAPRSQRPRRARGDTAAEAPRRPPEPRRSPRRAGAGSRAGARPGAAARRRRPRRGRPAQRGGAGRARRAPRAVRGDLAKYPAV